MKKQTYIQPTMQVVTLHANQSILTGSSLGINNNETPFQFSRELDFEEDPLLELLQ